MNDFWVTRVGRYSRNLEESPLKYGSVTKCAFAITVASVSRLDVLHSQRSYKELDTQSKILLRLLV